MRKYLPTIICAVLLAVYGLVLLTGDIISEGPLRAFAFPLIMIALLVNVLLLFVLAQLPGASVWGSESSGGWGPTLPTLTPVGWIVGSLIVLVIVFSLNSLPVVLRWLRRFRGR